MVTTALIFHQTSIFQENGLSATLAAGVFAIYSAASAVSSLAAGFVADRVGPKALVVFSMATLVATLALAAVIDSLFVAVVYVVVMGVSGGSYTIVHGTIWAHYYGRIGLGRIQGPAMTISVCASAIGPLPLAVFHSLTGTYTLGVLVMMVLRFCRWLCCFSPAPAGQAIRNGPSRMYLNRRRHTYSRGLVLRPLSTQLKQSTGYQPRRVANAVDAIDIEKSQ